MANDWIVVDVEIKNEIGAKFGWDDTDKLGVSCAVVYEFNTDKYRIFGDSERDLLRLRERLLKADRVTGYNTWKFDFPVIFGLPGRDRVSRLEGKSDDVLRRIWQAIGLDPDKFTPAHGGWGLDAVAQATLGIGKSGHGADAPIWYQAGDWGQLVDYCVNDVKVERDLAVFVDKYGYVLNGKGSRVQIPPWTSR